MSPTDQSWIGLLPRNLRNRFDGIGSFVSSVLEDENLKGKLSAESVDIVRAVCFAVTVHRFFREGCEAAKLAVDTFAELGISSFSVGNEIFAERNAAVIRGDQLASSLREALATGSLGSPGIDIEQFEGTPLRQVVKDLARALSHG